MGADASLGARQLLLGCIPVFVMRERDMDAYLPAYLQVPPPPPSPPPARLHPRYTASSTSTHVQPRVPNATSAQGWVRNASVLVSPKRFLRGDVDVVLLSETPYQRAVLKIQATISQNAHRLTYGLDRVPGGTLDVLISQIVAAPGLVGKTKGMTVQTSQV